MSKDLASRSISSVKWNAVSNGVNIVFGFTQSIVLARLLPIETFGVIAGAAAVVVLTEGFSNFGMGAAFNFRCKETEDLEHTAAVHFTLQLVLNLIWTVLMVGGGLLFIKPSPDGFHIAYYVITLSKTATNFVTTPHSILARQVQHRRLALVSIFDVVFTFIATSVLAILGQPLWSLLSMYIVTVAANFIMLYFWQPVWRPKLKWVTSTVKYFLNFGSKQVLSRWLLNALDRVDELWTKTYIGSVPLGFYSKAYSFAQYPGKVLASPVQSVTIGTYAEIAHNRQKLSSAFHQSNSLLIRTGFFMGGLLVLVAPEFITIFLGERWLPMLTAFRLMLPFTLFDPMKKTMGNLFVAVGKPEVIVKIRSIQLIVMVIGLFILGNLFNIEGVALAVDIMMVVGIAMVLTQAREYVDYSIRKLFGMPFLAVMSSLAVGFIFDHFFTPGFSDIISGIIKVFGFSAIYLSVMALFDRKEMKMFYRYFNQHVLKHFFD
jgi:O-antigen/teichoic acid export membrane protein